jgi:hypothetical protein
MTLQVIFYSSLNHLLKNNKNVTFSICSNKIGVLYNNNSIRLWKSTIICNYFL